MSPECAPPEQVLAWGIAAASLYTMAAVSALVVSLKKTSQPRLWLVFAAWYLTPAIGLTLDVINALVPGGLGAWFPAVILAVAISMMMLSLLALGTVVERLSRGEPPELIDVAALRESDLADAVRRAELRSESRIYAMALLARAGAGASPKGDA